jgi:hypothetical protein
MKLPTAFSLLLDIRAAIQFAFLPTLSAVRRNPGLLVRPQALSRTFMAHVWNGFGNPTDEGGRPAKQALITPNASGVVLDLGAGEYLRGLPNPQNETNLE